MFDFAENTKDMTAGEILNYYRNLYYAEPQVTERGIVANAINDFFCGGSSKGDVAREIIEEIDDKLREMAMEYANAGRKEYSLVCEVIHHKIVKAIGEKYSKE